MRVVSIVALVVSSVLWSANAVSADEGSSGLRNSEQTAQFADDTAGGLRRPQFADDTAGGLRRPQFADDTAGGLRRPQLA